MPTAATLAEPAGPDSPIPQPIGQALMRMVCRAQELFIQLRGAVLLGEAQYLPRRFARNPDAAKPRVLRTCAWLIALTRIMVGDRFYLRPDRPPAAPRPPGQPAPSRLPAGGRAALGLPPTPPRTPEQRNQAFLRTIRTTFATQPINRIAERLARRLGLRPGSDCWPTELLALTQTPAEYGAPQRALRDPAPTAPATSPHTATEQPPNAAPRELDLASALSARPAPPTPPPFHPRE